MEFFFEKYRALSLFSPKAKIESHNEVRRNNGRNKYLEKVYKVLSWNDPFISWCSFIAVNYIFWLMIWLEMKLLGLMFLLVLILFVYDHLFYNNGSSASDQHVMNDQYHDIEHFICTVKSALSHMCTLRNENPSIFCLVTSIFFLMLSLIARSMSGILLTYFIILGSFFLPLAYKSLPLRVKCGIKKIMKSASSFQDIIAEDDLIPVQSSCKIEDDDWESVDTDRTAESVTNSLISGINSMPSFMDAEDNNEILEEDLMPLTTPIDKEITRSVADLSSDSDSDLREMNFKEPCVSKDTSSDEGSKFEDGLCFSEDTADATRTVQNKKMGLYDVLSNYASALSVRAISLSNLMGVINTTERKSISTIQSSSSESEFEIVNHEDVKQ